MQRLKDTLAGEAFEVLAVDVGDGLRVRVLAGRYGDTAGPVEGIAVAPLYLDVEVAPGMRGMAYVPDGHTAFAYVFEGDAAFGSSDASRTR